jgi:hypothetical protein
MQEVQTEGVPPNNGRIIFETRGWTRNSKIELNRIVRLYRSVMEFIRAG